MRCKIVRNIRKESDTSGGEVLHSHLARDVFRNRSLNRPSTSSGEVLHFM